MSVCIFINYRRDDEILANMLKTINLHRDDLFVANVIPNHPVDNTPTPEDVAYYAPFVDAILNIIQPRAIVPWAILERDFQRLKIFI